MLVMTFLLDSRHRAGPASTQSTESMNGRLWAPLWKSSLRSATTNPAPHTIAPPAAVRRRPQRIGKTRAKELAALNRERARLEKAYTHACLSTTDASQTHRAALGAQIQDLNERIGEHRAVTKSLPHKVPVGETLDPDTVVRLEPERKIFTDLVQDARLPGRKRPARACRTAARARWRGRPGLPQGPVRYPRGPRPKRHRTPRALPLDGPARLNRALRALCEAATDERHLYPGTSLRMVFEGPSCLIEN